MLLTHSTDVAILTETWLDESIYDNEFVPAGYSVHRKDRESKGGGVAILYNKSLGMKKMPDVPGVEAVFCKVYCGNTRYVIGAIYRPPGSDVGILKNLRKYLDTQVRLGDKIILSGDFNLPEVDWSTFTARNRNDIHCEILIDMAFAFDLLQVVQNYTRIQGNSKSILDLFL